MQQQYVPINHVMSFNDQIRKMPAANRDSSLLMYSEDIDDNDDLENPDDHISDSDDDIDNKS